MLDYLEGKIQEILDEYLTIDVSGIGFKVIATKNTLSKFAKESQEKDFKLKIAVHLHIQENKWEIFGFSDLKEREAFLLLLGCRGVGTKAALNILNNFGPGKLKKIALGEVPVTALQQAPGIGAKSAERILVELKEKLPEMKNWILEKESEDKNPLEYSREDLFRTLNNLGYRASEIQNALANMPSLPQNLGEAVKQLLKIIR